MKISAASTLFLLAAGGSDAFTTTFAPSLTHHTFSERTTSGAVYIGRSSRMVRLEATSAASSSQVDGAEFSRLKQMAVKLRAEASALEAERAQELLEAALRAFQKFDTNKNNEISLDELQSGLEKMLKLKAGDALPEHRVRKLMQDFDKNNDGVLQLEEFVGVDQFRNRIETLAREEKENARGAAKAAQQEVEVAKQLEMRMELVNDKPPTGTDKIVSVLPYILPLLDGLLFGKSIILQNLDNPLVASVAALFTLYKGIPLGGLIVFFALQFLSTNPSLNRQVRFNMQQAISLDIALFFPSLLASVSTLIASGLGGSIPAGVTELGSEAVFFAMLAAVGYSTISSLFGVTPDKLPFISDRVSNRMISVDMFDGEGRFNPRLFNNVDEDEDNNNGQNR